LTIDVNLVYYISQVFYFVELVDQFKGHNQDFATLMMIGGENGRS
jgi:hypothetical protein